MSQGGGDGEEGGKAKVPSFFLNQTEQKVIQSNNISFFGLHQIYAQSIIHSIPLKIKSTKFKPPPLCVNLPSAKTSFSAAMLL